MEPAHADSADDERAQALIAEVIKQRARLGLRKTTGIAHLLDRCSSQQREVRDVAELAAVLLLRFAEAVKRTFQNLPIRLQAGRDDRTDAQAR